MKFVKWFFYSAAATLISIFCYLTNPIVVLFTDKNGELSGFLKLWQTWDDSVYSSDVVYHKELPQWLLYDFDKHYKEFQSNTDDFEKYATDAMKETDKKIQEVGRTRWYTICTDDDFTLKERIQRYICGVYWLTRNCSYGFGFWWFGRDVDGDKAVTIHEKQDVEYKTDGTVWSYSDSRKIIDNSKFYVERNVYIGWKIGSPEKGKKTRVMLAMRPFSWKIKKKA